MGVYFITSDGKLYIRGRTIAFRGGEGKIRTIPINTVEGLVVSVHVHVSSGYLTHPRVPPTVFISGYRPVSYLKPVCKGPSLLLKQVSLFSKLRLDVARAIELASVHHMKESLSGVPMDTVLRDAEWGFRTATGLEELRGIEGNLYKEYYERIGLLLPEYLVIGSREYRPPPNPGNALISFINSALYSYLTVWIITYGLEPSISFLHEPRERAFSLAFDLAEIYRPLLLLKVIRTSVGRYRLTKRDFVREGVGVYLSSKGRKKVVRAFVDALNRHLRLKKRRISVEGYIKLGVQRMRRAVEGGYVPVFPEAEGWV